MTDRELDQLRGRIAETDREILALVNARLGLVRAIRARKQALDMPFVDPQQEERLLVRLRETNPGVKVILSSGYSIDGEASQIMARGCNGFIQKPFGIKELSLKIREVLVQDR